MNLLYLSRSLQKYLWVHSSPGGYTVMVVVIIVDTSVEMFTRYFKVCEDIWGKKAVGRGKAVILSVICGKVGILLVVYIIWIYGPDIDQSL